MMYIGTCSLPRACAPARTLSRSQSPNHARSHGALYASRARSCRRDATARGRGLAERHERQRAQRTDNRHVLETRASSRHHHRHHPLALAIYARPRRAIARARFLARAASLRRSIASSSIDHSTRAFLKRPSRVTDCGGRAVRCTHGWVLRPRIHHSRTIGGMDHRPAECMDA